MICLLLIFLHRQIFYYADSGFFSKKYSFGKFFLETGYQAGYIFSAL